MVQGISDNGIFRPQQGFKQAAIGIKAGRIKDSILHAQELGLTLFQLFLHLLSAEEKAHGGHTIVVLIQGFLAGVDQLRGIGQTQVVISTKSQDLFPGVNLGINLLVRGDLPAQS